MVTKKPKMTKPLENSLLKQQKSTFNLIKTRANEIVLTLSIHGVPSIFRTKRAFCKIAWLLLTLLFSGACIYFSTDCILDYLNYDTVTSISEITEQESEFPTISICQGKSLPNRDILPLNVLDCSFNGNNHCKYNYKYYFEQFIDHFYGNCYRFNSGKNFFNQNTTILKSSIPGLNFGLNLELALNTPNQYNELVVHLHNKSSPAYELYYEEHFIGSGVKSYFPIERITTKNLGPPYGNCVNASLFSLNRTIIEFFQRKGKSYTQRECYQLCGNLYFVESSGCGCGAGLDLDQVDSQCFFTTNLTVKMCLQRYANWFQKDALSNKCAKFCPVECEINSFTSNPYIRRVDGLKNSTSSTNWYKNFTSYNDFRLRYFSISVYFRELKYILIEQSPKTQFFDALSNFGGIMGIFIGASFLSFFEIIELFLEPIFILAEKNCFKSKH